MVTSRWIYKIKHATYGSIEKYKVRFVLRGFSHKEGVEYEETFSLVSRYASIRAVISIASEMVEDTSDGCEDCLPQLCDQGFEVHGRESHLCRLKKAL